MAGARDAFRTLVIGLCMGAAEAVPGVSGGTIALIAGVYERLIAAVTALTPTNVSRVLRAALPPIDRDELDGALGDVDASFLLPLGLGMVAAVVLLLRVVTYADEHYPVVLFGFFFGLIAASVVVLSRAVVVSSRRHVVAVAVGFLVTFALSGGVTLLSGHGPVLTFVAGTLAVSGLVLPGISGSLILLILGQYVFLAGTLSAFTDRLGELLAGGAPSGVVGPGTTLVTFVLGGLVGLFTISRLVDRALDRDRETTLAVLVSLVAGALRAPIAEIGGRPDVSWSPRVLGTFALTAAFGAGLLLVIDRYALDVEVTEGTGTEP